MLQNTFFKLIVALLSTFILFSQLADAKTVESKTSSLPLQLIPISDQAKTLFKDARYHYFYRLRNNNDHAVHYVINLTDQKTIAKHGIVLNEKNVSSSCKLGEPAILQAKSSCLIKLQLHTLNPDFLKQQVSIFELASDTGIQNGTHTTSSRHVSITVQENNHQYHNLIFFGDSLSDIGNKSFQINPIEGATLWPALLTEELKENLAIKNDVIRSKSNTESANDANIDYARGGAQTQIQCPISETDCSLNVSQQIEEYIQQLGNDRPNPDTLIFIWIGGNDILNKHLSDKKYKISKSIATIEENINALLKLGIAEKNIYIINLPDMSVLPLFRIFPGTLKQDSENFDQQLAVLIQQTFAKSHLLLMNEFFNKIISNPEAYEFSKKNILKACKTILKPNPNPACTGYMSWDGVHPTYKTQQYIANNIFSSL